MQNARKVCKDCNIEKPIDSFPPDTQNKDRRKTRCRPCFNEFMKKYKNKPEYREKRNAWRRSPEEQEKRRQYLARPEVKSRVLEQRRARYAEKPKDLNFKFDSRLRVLIRRSVATGKNNRSWRELVDFDIDQFKSHLEKQFTKGMTWDHFLRGEIHIDHITPIKEFKISSPDCPEFKACWSLANLRPMWALENNHKRAKRMFLI